MSYGVRPHLFKRTPKSPTGFQKRFPKCIHEFPKRFEDFNKCSKCFQRVFHRVSKRVSSMGFQGVSNVFPNSVQRDSRGFQRVPKCFPKVSNVSEGCPRISWCYHRFSKKGSDGFPKCFYKMFNAMGFSKGYQRFPQGVLQVFHRFLKGFQRVSRRRDVKGF